MYYNNEFGNNVDSSAFIQDLDITSSQRHWFTTTIGLCRANTHINVNISYYKKNG